MVNIGALGRHKTAFKHKMYSSRIFGDLFVEKEGCLHIHNSSSEEVRGLEVLIKNLKLKINSGDVPSWANPIVSLSG
jgi:hypothetical protein